MKRLLIAFAFVGAPCGPAYSQSAAVPAPNNVVMVDQEPGATADAKFSACIRTLRSSGGSCNATGFGGTTQTLAATVTTVPGVYLIMSPATTFQPSGPAVDMFSIAENSGIDGLTVNALKVSNYDGTVVKFAANCLQSDRCYLRDFNLINGTNGTNPQTGTAVLLQAASGVNALSFVEVGPGKITGFLNGLYLTATGPIASNNFVNDTKIHNVTITNAVHCITLYSDPGDVEGNTFDQVTCEAGGGNIAHATGFVVEGSAGSNAKANMFINGNIWDYGVTTTQTSYSFDANTSVNWLQANVNHGGSDNYSDAGANNQIWNTGYPLQVRQMGIGRLLIVPATGYAEYWLTTNGTGNQVCISNGSSPGTNPVCVDPSGNVNIPSGANYEVGGASVLSSSSKQPHTCTAGQLWTNPSPADASHVLAVCAPANTWTYVPVQR